VEGVGDEAHNRQNVFLISDNYARTVKYIYALAGGIPCLSYNWISECLLKVISSKFSICFKFLKEFKFKIFQQRVVEYKSFELSSGYGIESKVVIPPHRQRPLEGFKVYVTGATDELYKYWKPVLTAAGADPKRHNLKSKGTQFKDSN
jgi:hypothetical protein